MLKQNKISQYTIKKIIKHFCVDINATKTSILLWLNRKTINRYFNIFREIIFDYQMNLFKNKLSWEFEVDESYFWATRIRWSKVRLKRWRWTIKQPVFWLLKRDWKVYTEIVPNCKKKTLQKIIRWKVSLESIIHSDWWPWYHWLVDVWYNKHYRVNHWKSEFSKWNWIHINWIENFWSFTKRRLNKFNWVKKNFELHLKECEFRYKESEIELEKKLTKLYTIFTKK